MRPEAQREVIREQLGNTLVHTNLPALGALRRGKVRDAYVRGDRMFLIATDRLSAFDRVLTTIPFKGEILTRTATYWFDRTRDIVDNHVIEVPDPSVMLVRLCDPIPVELVVRGYLTGSLWRDYLEGKHLAYDLSLPSAMNCDQRFAAPIITPTTKAAVGEHDRPISRAEIISSGLVEESVYAECERLALALFERGASLSAERGLILVDTKYEFGISNGRVVLMDEIHTPDSSRYWIAECYEERFRARESQKMLDKENIRQWLINERGYRGEGEPPEIPDELRIDLSAVYLEAHRMITGASFPLVTTSVEERLAQNLSSFLE